jgi:solute carrier family 25 citrate transporter 1
MNYKGNKPYKIYIAGGLSGITSLMAIYPTEYLKTQVQLHGNQLSLTQLIKKTYSNWGVKGFYKGMVPLLIGSAPRSMFKFVGYEQAHYHLKNYQVFNKSPNLLNFISGASAGILTSILTSSPADNIKMKGIFYQTQKNIKLNTKQSIRKIWKDEGLYGFYKGLSSTMMKESLTFGLRFTFYHNIFNVLHHAEAVIKSTSHDKLPKNSVTSAIAGGIAGGIVCIINNPFDVTQTRMQTNYSHKYKSLPHCLFTIVKEEGPLALWKGASYRSLRAVPGIMIAFYVYEIICKTL